MTKTVLITGGTGKVGTQIVQHFFKKGLNIIFIAKEQKETNLLIKKIKKIYNNLTNQIFGLATNLIKKNFHKKVIELLNDKKISPNYLINCVRNLDFLKIGSDGITQRQEWLGELTLDVIVPYELSMALANQENCKLEHIINISSMYGIVPPNPFLYNKPEIESPIQYGVAKAAQIHLTKELAIRLAPQNIRVNSISFGGIEGRVNEEFKKKYAQLCPLKNMLKKEEIIGAIDFLASNKSVGMTGHNLVVDGGWTVW